MVRTLFWIAGIFVLLSTNLGVLDHMGRITADVLKVDFLRDNERWTESRIYFVVIWASLTPHSAAAPGPGAPGDHAGRFTPRVGGLRGLQDQEEVTGLDRRAAGHENPRYGSGVRRADVRLHLHRLDRAELGASGHLLAR